MCLAFLTSFLLPLHVYCCFAPSKKCSCLSASPKQQVATHAVPRYPHIPTLSSRTNFKPASPRSKDLSWSAPSIRREPLQPRRETVNSAYAFSLGMSNIPKIHLVRADQSHHSSTAGGGPTGCTMRSIQCMRTLSTGWPMPMLM